MLNGALFFAFGAMSLENGTHTDMQAIPTHIALGIFKRLIINIAVETVSVNFKSVKPSYILKEGDIIEFNPIQKVEILPEDIPLYIVWEDENMLVVNKPSGMLTHPTAIETSGTLVNALLYRYAENLSDINGEFRRGIIHRLDRNLSLIHI